MWYFNQCDIFTEQCQTISDSFILTQTKGTLGQKLTYFELFSYIYVPPEIRHCYNSMKTLCSVRALYARYVGIGEVYAVGLEWFFTIYKQCKILGLVVEQCVVKGTSL